MNKNVTHHSPVVPEPLKPLYFLRDGKNLSTLTGEAVSLPVGNFSDSPASAAVPFPERSQHRLKIFRLPGFEKKVLVGEGMPEANAAGVEGETGY